MLKKVNENLKFLNEYNYLIEKNIFNTENFNLFDLNFILDKISLNQKNLILRYYYYNDIEKIKIILKNIAYKKQKQLKNYYLNDIKF